MSKHLLPLCLLSLLLLCAPPLWGQTLKPGVRPPAGADLGDDEEGTSIKPGAKPPVKVTLDKVVVTGIDPDSHVKLPPDGTTVEKRRLVGSNLDTQMTVTVLKSNAPTSAITATLKPTNRSDRRRLWLTAKEEAPAGSDYKVRLTAGSRTIHLPLTVEVLPKTLDPDALSSVPSAVLGEKQPALDPVARDGLRKGSKKPKLKKDADKVTVFGEKSQELRLPGQEELAEGAAEDAPTVKLGHLASKGGVVEFPDAILEVKRADAIDAWGSYWADRPAITNRFRWTTSLEDLVSFRWEVADYANFQNIIASGVSGDVAEPGKFVYFTIDFAQIAGSRPPPLHYFVRVVPAQRPEGSTAAVGVDADTSNYVHVSIMMPGEVTQFTEPVVQVLMPGYGCRPGGNFKLRGFNFGNTPGSIRLIGDFPGGRVVLENLEWTSTFVRGQVPMIRGVMDQEVSIQVEAQGGGRSNTDFTCSFKATREEIKLYELCDGILVHMGGKYADADDTHSSPRDRMSQRLTGWHRSSDGQSGVDQVKVPRTLLNGWRYTRIDWAKISSDHVDGRILHVTGFTPGSNPHTIGIHWEIGDDAEVGWRMNVYAKGPAGVRLWADKFYQAQFCQPRGY